MPRHQSQLRPRARPRSPRCRARRSMQMAEKTANAAWREGQAFPGLVDGDEGPVGGAVRSGNGSWPKEKDDESHQAESAQGQAAGVQIPLVVQQPGSKGNIQVEREVQQQSVRLESDQPVQGGDRHFPHGEDVEVEQQEVTDKEGDENDRPGHQFETPMGLQPSAKPARPGRFLSAPEGGGHLTISAVFHGRYRLFSYCDGSPCKNGCGFLRPLK